MVVESHLLFHMFKDIASCGRSRAAVFKQHFIDVVDVLFKLCSFFADWSKQFLNDVVQKEFDLDVAKTAPLIVGFQLVKVLVLWQELCKVLIGAEGVKI